MANRSRSSHIAPPAPTRPQLESGASQFMLIEREVENEFRPRILDLIQSRVNALADSMKGKAPKCECGRTMSFHDERTVSWISRFGRVSVQNRRYRCLPCKRECHPLLDLLGVEPGRISGSLARLLALLAVVAPYELAARLAWLLLGVNVSAMGVWRVFQRLGCAAAQYSEDLSAYHADGRNETKPMEAAPDAVVVGFDGCMVGMQLRKHRRSHKTCSELLQPLPETEDERFREVKTGVLLLPVERYQPSPGRCSVVRRFLVTCLGNADDIYNRVWAQLQELGWLGVNTVVVIVGDGAQWIWNRVNMFSRRCEILDFWHAVEHAWEFARVRYGEGSKRADRWVHQIANQLRAGKVEQVIAHLKRLNPSIPQVREKLDDLIRYYSEDTQRMHYDEYIRLGYGIGSGAVESAHKQVVHARLRQAGMRWSELGVRNLLALRLLLLNDDWRLLDQMDLTPLEIPQRLIRQLFELDADYAEALWALDQSPMKFNVRAMTPDTLAALEQLPAAVERFRKNLPPRAHPKLKRLEAAVRKNLDPKEAYNMVPGQDA
jgi:hypothetical protein